MTDTPATAAPPQMLVPTIGMPQTAFRAIALAAKHGLAHLEGEAFEAAANALIAAGRALDSAAKAANPPSAPADAPPIVPVPPLPGT